MAKRRASGEGMIRQKKKGQWEGRIVVGHKENGDPIFRYVYAKTQKELIDKLHYKIDEFRDAELTEDSKMSLGAWLDIWAEKFMKGIVRDSTLESYMQYANSYVKARLGDKPIAFITTADIQKLYNDLRKNGRWEARVVVGYYEKGLPITKNVTALEKGKCFEKLEKLKQEVGIIKRDTVKPNMLFGEWMDFWYQQYAKMTIRKTTQACYENRIYDHIIPQIGKIPLDKLTQNDLQQFYAKLKKSGRLQYTESFGEGLSDRMVRSVHGNCRTALANGMDVKTLSTIIGHVSSQTTLDIYLHSTDEMQRLAATKIDKALRGNNGAYIADSKTPEDSTKEPQAAKFEAVKGKRRKSGTGCISKLGENLYEGRYSPKGADGKRISRNIYAKTEEECERFLAEMIVEMKAEIKAEKKSLKAV